MKSDNNMLLECDEKLLLSSKNESLLLVERLVEDLCTMLEIKEELSGNILISLTEAVNNAMIHGNKSDPEKIVTLQYEVTPDRISFLVKDEGSGFDEKNIPDPTSNDSISKEGGRGIFIMKKLTDQIEFIPPGNMVKLHFKLN